MQIFLMNINDITIWRNRGGLMRVKLIGKRSFQKAWIGSQKIMSRFNRTDQNQVDFQQDRLWSVSAKFPKFADLNYQSQDLTSWANKNHWVMSTD